MWLTSMYWFGPFVDLSGNALSIRRVWLARVKQIANRISTLRKGRRLVADIFFTLWVSTDVLALIEGTTPVLPLSIFGAICGVLLVGFEWSIFYEEYTASGPLHLLWQPRFVQPPRQPYLYVHFESKNNLPFEVRCTFTDDENLPLGPHSEFQEFVPSKDTREFTYWTRIHRDLLDPLQKFRLHLEIASLLAQPKLRDHWIYNYALDKASGKFKHASGCVGVGNLTTQTWWSCEDQDENWLKWEDGL